MSRASLLAAAAMSMIAAAGTSTSTTGGPAGPDGRVVAEPLPLAQSNPAQGGQANRAPRAGDLLSRLFGGVSLYYEKSHKRGPGWTFAQVKRMARKKRNQQRHKAACRRAKG